MEWNEEKEKKILKKYRFTLTFRIIRVVGAFFILLWIYSFIVQMIGQTSHFERKNQYDFNLMLDWKYPNLTTDMSGGSDYHLSNLFTETTTLPLYEEIGKEQYYVGTLKGKETVIPTFSKLHIQRNTLNENHGFRFYLPEDLKSGGTAIKINNENAWMTLEKVHEGTVADMAFSISNFEDPKELLQEIEKYDVHVLWMPLLSGEFKEFDPNSYGGGSGSISIDGAYGLSYGRKHDEDFSSQSQISLTSEHVERNETMMLNNMKELLDEEGKSYYEGYLGLDHLKERYQYLKENGFQVYGAVVTGPVKELLKLKELDGIHGVQIGSFQYWNWDNY